MKQQIYEQFGNKSQVLSD